MEIFESIAVGLICAFESRYYVHMMQLESYQLDGYGRWLKKNRDMYLGWTLTIGVGLTILYFVFSLIFRVLAGGAGVTIAKVAALLVFLAAAFVLDGSLHKLPAKKKLVFTARCKRLYAILTVLSVAAALFIAYLGVPPYLLFVGVPYLTLAAAYLAQPLEKRISLHYLNDAKRILASRPDLIKIGITGSYGKTSAKFILASILSEQFTVLAPPASYNTPMGLTRVIREQLEARHQVFIAEMGARHVGDIRELVELVHPKYGVLTSVGPQHLETFGSLENVANTKFELIEGLPKDGVGFFAADGGEVDKLYERAKCEKRRAGLEGGFLAMRAEEIEVGAFGSRFTLVDAEGGRAKCVTKLLGRHNIQNIVLCCAVASRLGMPLEKIARGVAKAEPVEHRLQLIPGANGLTVIDDAFNSNPTGSKAALDVLAAFPARRIVVTPGMVELGDSEEALNARFGTQIAACCDEAILIGKKRALPIARGAREAGMDDEHIHITATLEEATRLLGTLAKAGDTVLFENDLPDNYS